MGQWLEVPRACPDSEEGPLILLKLWKCCITSQSFCSPIRKKKKKRKGLERMVLISLLALTFWHSILLRFL